MTDQIVLIVRLQAKPGKKPALLAQLEALAATMTPKPISLAPSSTAISTGLTI